MQTAPLTTRKPDDCLAYVRTPLAALGDRTGGVRVDEFCGQVAALAARLPEARYALNLCDNRYLFMLSFCAAMVRGQSNLLPPNKALATQAALLTRYPGSYVLHDGVDVAPGCRALDIGQLSLRAAAAGSIPSIGLDFPAAITFTSGSTGDAKPHLKPWRTFVVSTGINADHMLVRPQHLVSALATVPGQHMWGMETSILLPLMRRLCISDARPLFPQDVRAALDQLEAPRMLVSTPVHLRALARSGLDFPSVELILCATAPLSKALARQVEVAFGGRLLEVYGCSEVGSMACRHTAEAEVWALFEGLSVDVVDGQYVASAAHLPAPVSLQDRLQTVGRGRFRLLGRGDDMVEIGGKRGSLQALNNLLLSAEGVRDGAVFLPDTERSVDRLVAAVVLDDPAAKKKIAAHFRAHVDPVFVPRPIHVVPSLPREANGKLPRARLLSLLARLQG